MTWPIAFTVVGLAFVGTYGLLMWRILNAIKKL